MAKRCQTEDENKGLQTIAEQVDTSICELAAPELTPVLLQMKSVGTVLMGDFVHSVTVDKLNTLWCINLRRTGDFL